MTRDPIRLLKSLFPWPAEKPNVSERHERWFNRRKQILLRKVVPRDAKLVVELGSWLGDSTRWFCEWCPDATVVAVDTWLGSAEHLLKKRSLLPVLHDTFLANCWQYRDRLIPFRNTSLAALNFLHELRLYPNVIYFDSDHSKHGLFAELVTATDHWLDSVFVGDDYEEGNSVAAAMGDFQQWADYCYEIETLHNTWYLKRDEE